MHKSPQWKASLGRVNEWAESLPSNSTTHNVGRVFPGNRRASYVSLIGFLTITGSKHHGGDALPRHGHCCLREIFLRQCLRTSHAYSTERIPATRQIFNHPIQQLHGWWLASSRLGSVASKQLENLGQSGWPESLRVSRFFSARATKIKPQNDVFLYFQFS